MTRTSNNQAYNTYDYTSMFCGCDEDDTKFDCDKNGRTENLLATRVINGQTDYCYDMGSNGQIRAYRITKQ
jgi:hypothetical protein